MLIVDNFEDGCFLNFENLIPVPDFEGESSDTILLSLCEYLLSFEGKNDVRMKVVKDFNLYHLRTYKMMSFSKLNANPLRRRSKSLKFDY